MLDDFCSNIEGRIVGFWYWFISVINSCFYSCSLKIEKWFLSIHLNFTCFSLISYFGEDLNVRSHSFSRLNSQTSLNALLISFSLPRSRHNPDLSFECKLLVLAHPFLTNAVKWIYFLSVWKCFIDVL